MLSPFFSLCPFFVRYCSATKKKTTHRGVCFDRHTQKKTTDTFLFGQPTPFFRFLRGCLWRRAVWCSRNGWMAWSSARCPNRCRWAAVGPEWYLWRFFRGGWWLMVVDGWSNNRFLLKAKREWLFCFQHGGSQFSSCIKFFFQPGWGRFCCGCFFQVREKLTGNSLNQPQLPQQNCFSRLPAYVLQPFGKGSSQTKG